MATVTTVGFITADWPKILRRGILSFLAHCDAHARWPRFLVIDGSHEPSSRRATRAVVNGLGTSSPHDLRYVGPDEAARLSAGLARCGAPIGSFAPGTIGENRNLLLLLTAGEYVLTVDDDIVCDLRAHEGDTPKGRGHRPS